MEGECAFCSEPLSNGSQVTKLGDKGVAGIIKTSALNNDDVQVQSGQFVHTKCRRDYDRDGGRRKRPLIVEKHQSLRSSEPTFCFKGQCLFCGFGDKYQGRQKDHLLIPVRTIIFQETVKKICHDRGDEWSETVLMRISCVHDLHAADAVYHQLCNVNFRTLKQTPVCFQRNCDSNSSVKKRKRGRPVGTDREEAFLKVVDDLEANDEELTTVQDLILQMADRLQESESESEAYGVTHMKEILRQHFGDKIVIAEVNGKKNVVTFRQKASSIISDFYSQPRGTDLEAEKLRLIEATVKLIKSDIKSIVQSKDLYPTTLEMNSVQETSAFLPNTLRHFLDCLFVGKNKDVKALKVSSIGQALMQATRPKVLLAPLQLGLGVQMHSHFASRFLVDCLYKHGFCCSYSEIQNYQRSAATQSGTDIPGYIPGHFIQYAADNVDHNIRTLDGSGTFHGMGTLANITPKVASASVIKRVTVTAKDIHEVGKIDIRHYTAPTNNFRKLEYKKFMLSEVQTSEKMTNVDLLWKTVFAARPKRPGWSGFMQHVSEGIHPGTSSSRLLPMIDMDPGDLTCIYSTLCFVSDHAKRYDVTPVVTFDQPLWWKATSIIENEKEGSPLKSVVLRLGGFHTLMSYLSCIGHVMEGSGLKEILEQVFNRNTVTHIMSGKAIARALRGHFLVDSALHTVLLEEKLGFSFFPSATTKDYVEIEEEQGTYPEFDDEDEPEEMDSCDNSQDDGSSGGNPALPVIMEDIAHLLDQLLAGEISLFEVDSSPILDKVRELIYCASKKQDESRRTCQLWTMYMNMLDTIRKFLRSERTGNWDLHLHALSEMLPYLAAAGHYAYTKSVQIYLQKMSNLKTTNEQLYDQFKKGLHVVRRSDRFWAGLSPDLVIEQTLMRSLKTTGGLTRGRGMTETQRNVWCMSSPVCAEVNQAMQQLTNVTFTTSEQHKDLSAARQNRDSKDVKKLIGFLKDKKPFEDQGSLRNIVTGIVADEKVNVTQAKEIGEKILNGMIGKEVYNYSLRKKDTVVTMESKSKVKIDGEEVHIDPQLLFQRLVIISTQKDNLEDAFCYELCAFPPALFECRNILLKANKSILASAIWELAPPISEEERKCMNSSPVKYVLDGGALLHRIQWEIGQTYDTICQKYVSYVIKRYKQPIVIFDGYDCGPTPKDCTHFRRCGAAPMARNVEISPSMHLRMKKDNFLTNKRNKQQFINMLSSYLEKSGAEVNHAEGDADVLIVSTALKTAETCNTILIGDDTDLIVLLCHHATSNHMKIFFHPEPKSGQSERYMDIHQVQSALGNQVCQCLLFAHAILGCDTTSRLFGFGKAAGLKLIQKNKTFIEQAKVFNKKGCSQAEIVAAGEMAVLCLYGSKEKNLNQLRLQKFQELVRTSKKAVQPKNLPPTSAALKFHSLRVYYQVQTWQGEELDAESWGWKVDSGRMVPLQTDMDIAPKGLLQVVRCNCRAGCSTRRCGCKKLTIPCTAACGECKGICENKEEVDDETDDI